MSVDQLIGTAIVIAQAGGRMGPGELAAVLNYDYEHTAGVVDFLSSLGVIETVGNDASLTEIGKRIASSGISARRGLFADVTLQLPIMRAIVDTVSGQPDQSIPRRQLMDSLGAQSCPEHADRVLDHVVAWGRYAGLLSYDALTEQISLS